MQLLILSAFNLLLLTPWNFSFRLLLSACCDLMTSLSTLSPACLSSWHNVGSHAFVNTTRLVSYKLPYVLWWCSGSLKLNSCLQHLVI